jgi:hypothetical protein
MTSYHTRRFAARAGLSLPNGLELREAPLWGRAASRTSSQCCSGSIPWDPELARGNCPAARVSAQSFSRIPAGKASPTFRTPAGSASARGCGKTPNSPIAFPLGTRIARLQSTLAPLPCQSAQALGDGSPPARLFTQSGEPLGGRRAFLLVRVPPTLRCDAWSWPFCRHANLR